MSSNGKIRLDPNALTMGDLRRAKIVLGGQNPWELLQDPVEAIILAIWCTRSRDDPSYTFDMAAAEPMGNFELTTDDGDDAGPPPTGGPDGSPSSRPKPSAENGSAPKRPGGVPASSSSSGTA